MADKKKLPNPIWGFKPVVGKQHITLPVMKYIISILLFLCSSLGILSFSFLYLTFTTSCSHTQNQFGQKVIPFPADTVASRQQIAQIRSLPNDVFDAASFTDKDQLTIPYRLFKPAADQHNTTAKLPLVVVFHSAGRPIGTDNVSQLGILPKLFAGADIQSKYPAYVLAPQFATRSSDYVTDSSRNVLASIPRPCLATALELIDSLKRTLNIDDKRIYAIGFSMGGSTVINALSARPNLFAAGISIAGIPQFSRIDDIKSIPLWLIHGTEDTENTIDSDLQFYKELKGGKHTRFWKLANTSHDNIFSTSILGETLPGWLFKQQRK